MEGVNYIIFICFALPFILGIPIVRRNTRIILLFILIGMCCCLFISEINGLLYRALNQDMFYITTNITPITEEVIKTIPVLIFAIFISREREELLTVAFMTGLGFALIENSTILVQTILARSQIDIMWALIRTFGAGLLHSMCTTMVGIGITFIKDHKKLFICGTYALLSLAIVFHSVYNTLIQSEYKYLGAVLPLLTYIPLAVVLIMMHKNQEADREAEELKPEK